MPIELSLEGLCVWGPQDNPQVQWFDNQHMGAPTALSYSTDKVNRGKNGAWGGAGWPGTSFQGASPVEAQDTLDSLAMVWQHAKGCQPGKLVRDSAPRVLLGAGRRGTLYLPSTNIKDFRKGSRGSVQIALSVQCGQWATLVSSGNVGNRLLPPTPPQNPSSQRPANGQHRKRVFFKENSQVRSVNE